jgi:DNA polymerase iota
LPRYAARRLGVTKLQGITVAKERCPGLVLINGEDLSPYRQASKQILSVLQRFGVAERLGMDEVSSVAWIRVREHVETLQDL